MYGIKQNKDVEAVRSMISTITLPKFVPRSGVTIDTTDAEMESRRGGGGSVGKLETCQNLCQT